MDPKGTTGVKEPALFGDLVATGRFCRDTRLGGLLHRGSVSLREVSDGDSLHLCVEGSKVTAHVDHFSPVAGTCPDGRCRYSVRAVIAHVVAYLRSQARQLAAGARGRHRCRLECEVVEDERCEPASPPAPPPAS
ncbi:MAG TPA: hypothetical protein VFJ85_14120 [Acidimicrobiales bacterium]|nr:hypothetical protein [Acidimicrobiales bacterium]